MPTPIEILLDPLSLIIIGMYMVLMLWEWILPARTLPRVKYWKLKGGLSFAIFFYLSSYLPMIIDPFLSEYMLFDLSNLHPVYGAVIGVLIYEFGLYFWHRTMHASDFLWKTLHQMHHSAERVDTYGAFFFSPLDMIGFILLGSVCFAVLIGLSPAAITAVLLTTNFFSIFQHANIKTPHWLGYFIQRPESHNHHHGAGIHRNNYSDLPVFDILFGTFENPRTFAGATGFYNGASNRIVDMLLFRDVTKPRGVMDKKPRKIISNKSTLMIAVLLIAFWSCDRSDDFAPLQPLLGTYTGTFERGEIVSAVELTFSNDKFYGKSEKENFPAICSGSFSLTSDTIVFEDECFWPGNFDWSLILDEAWSYSATDSSLMMVNALGDRYDLIKQ